MLRPFRVLATADLHLKDDTPDDLRLGLQEVDDYARLALERSTRHVVIAGDVFHYKHRLSVEMLIAVQQRLEQWLYSGVTFILLRGNHDTSDTSDPERTPLQLFSRVATVITSPMLVEEEDCVVLFLPWYPPEQYRKLLSHFASFALGYNKPRILISHVSLQEGKVSPSNVRITVPLRYKDLLPEVFTGGIYLGDYHAHQRFGRANDVYFGAARPRTFGDFDNVGAWELTVDRARAIPLPSPYPAYNSWRVDSKADLPLGGWTPTNHNRCYCTNSLRDHVAHLYPGMSILPIEGTVALGEGRLTEIPSQDKFAIAKRWAELRRLGPEFTPEIRRFIQ